MNLLIILAVLFGALLILVPLLERHGKPMSPEKMQKYSSILRILLVIMMVAMVIRYVTDGYV